MKIGILTLPLHGNYGGILQAWALQTVLERMGHTVNVFAPKRKRQWMFNVYLKRIAHKLLGKTLEIPVFFEMTHRYKELHPVQGFIRQKIKSKYLTDLNRINHLDYDALIIGSDQVWRKELFLPMWKTDCQTDPFLGFLNNKASRKIAYAASMGVDNWTFDVKANEAIKQEIKKFNVVSVREKSAVGIISGMFGIDVAHVCDPTMLLDSEDYIALVGENKKADNSSIVSYILDRNSNTDAILHKVMKSHNLPHRELNERTTSGSAKAIEDWISGFAEAKIIVTDSFHGCMFSLIFRKPLVFIGNHERGNARFQSLIETFGLQANHVADESDFDPEASYALPVDIENKINVFREYSFDFLKKSLS